MPPMRLGRAGLWVAVTMSLLMLTPAAPAQESPLNRITVDVSWQDDHLLYLSYQISQEGNPANVADGPYSHGCASLPQGHDTTPRTLEVDSGRHTPGRYVVIAYFMNWCLDYTDAGSEEPDPLHASEIYPEGMPIGVTATVTYREGEAVIRTTHLQGTAAVAWGPISDHWAILGVIELAEPAGDGPPPADQADDPVTPADEAGPGDSGAMWEPGPSRLPRGWGLALLIVAITLGITSVSLLVGYLVRLRMGWSHQEAAVDAVRAEGAEPGAGEDGSPGVPLDILQEASGRLERFPDGRVASFPPPTSPVAPPATDPIPRPGTRSTQAQTPSGHHRTRPGLQPGSYRWVEFPEPVYLERPAPGGGVELITTHLIGPVLIGTPDPAFPGHSPAYIQDGRHIGWVRTADIPG